jgi:hypothetical protein
MMEVLCFVYLNVFIIYNRKAYILATFNNAPYYNVIALINAYHVMMV